MATLTELHINARKVETAKASAPPLADYPAGLDGHEIGNPQIGDINGLVRTNYFNGRYLDAEALRRDQVYFARRDRVVEQTEHAGIAWGLGLDYPPTGRRVHDDVEDFFTVDSTISLRPGVAFDGEGRLIVVDRPFAFTLDELLTEYAQAPVRAVKPRTRFQPCICVERLPGNESVGPEYETGAYILVISPTTRPEGSARVYRDPCATDRGVHCDADAWRHAFRLSLVRYDTFQHEVGDQQYFLTPCTLRGLLAAHYFDVWERNLLERWRPRFAEDHRFCEGLGPLQRAPGAVALAMCFVTNQGDVMVFDPWIPRRYQISSASRAWEAAVRGAPTPTASVARRHQFQCQLSECAGAELNRGPIVDLYMSGFRHLAPCGFLPIDLPDGTLAQAEAAWRDLGDGMHEVQRIEFVRRQADKYFLGTNLLPRYRVALYEDDIFEEIGIAQEKDPMIVRQGSPTLWHCLSRMFFSLGVLGYRALEWIPTEYDHEGTHLGDLFQCLLLGDRITLEQIVNRELELVDVIIPLYGRRRHGVAIPISDEVRRFMEDVPVDVDIVTDLIGDSISTREFVFFVKRRAVLDDWLYLLLDALLDVLGLLRIMKEFTFERQNDEDEDEEGEQQAIYEVREDAIKNSFRVGWARDQRSLYIPTYRLAETKFDLRIEVFESPDVREFLSGVIVRSHPELRNADVVDQFDALAEARAEELRAQGVDEVDALNRGRYDAIDVMLEEYPAFADYKVVAALDPRLLDTVHAEVREKAVDGSSLAAEAFDPQKVSKLPTKAAEVYHAARAEFGREVVLVGDKKIARNELLRRSKSQLEEIGASAELIESLARDGRKLERASVRIAQSAVAGPQLAEAYEAAVIEHGEDAALEALARKQGFKTVAKDIEAVKAVVGAGGVDRLMNTMRAQ